MTTGTPAARLGQGGLGLGGFKGLGGLGGWGAWGGWWGLGGLGYSETPRPRAILFLGSLGIAESKKAPAFPGVQESCALSYDRRVRGVVLVGKMVLPGVMCRPKSQQIFRDAAFDCFCGGICRG